MLVRGSCNGVVDMFLIDKKTGETVKEFKNIPNHVNMVNYTTNSHSLVLFKREMEGVDIPNVMHMKTDCWLKSLPEGEDFLDEDACLFKNRRKFIGTSCAYTETVKDDKEYVVIKATDEYNINLKDIVGEFKAISFCGDSIGTERHMLTVTNMRDYNYVTGDQEDNKAITFNEFINNAFPLDGSNTRGYRLYSNYEIDRRNHRIDYIYKDYITPFSFINIKDNGVNTVLELDGADFELKVFYNIYYWFPKVLEPMPFTINKERYVMTGSLDDKFMTNRNEISLSRQGYSIDVTKSLVSSGDAIYERHKNYVKCKCGFYIQDSKVLDGSTSESICQFKFQTQYAIYRLVSEPSIIKKPLDLRVEFMFYWEMYSDNTLPKLENNIWRA